MTEQPYDSGGYLPGPSVSVTLDDAECVISAEDIQAGQWRCSRGDGRHLQAAHPDGGRTVYERPTT